MPAVRTRRILDTAGVEAVLAAAEDAALEQGYRVVIAVVDASGRLLGLRRTEDAQAASDQVAIDKARTAAIFVRPSREIEEQVNGGRLGGLALHGARALIGGIPLVVAGEVVGASAPAARPPVRTSRSPSRAPPPSSAPARSPHSRTPGREPPPRRPRR